MNFKPISKSSVINANGINRATNVVPKITNSLVNNVPLKNHELYLPGIKFGANSSKNSSSPNKLLALARHQNGFDFYNSCCSKTKSGSSLNGRKASSTYKTAGKHRKFLCQYRNHNSNEDLIELLRKGFILSKIPYPIGAYFCKETDDSGKQGPKSKNSQDDACQIKKERIRQLNIDIYNIKTNIDGLCKSKIKKDDPCKPKAELQNVILSKCGIQMDSNGPAKENSTVKKTPNISLGKSSGATKKQKLASKQQDSSPPSENDDHGSMVGGDGGGNGHAAWKNTKCKKMDFSCPPKKGTPLTCLPKSNVCHDVSEALKAINEMQNDPCQHLQNNQKTPCKMVDGKIVCQITNMCCVLEKYDSCNPKHTNIPEPKSGDLQFSCRIDDVFCVCTKIEKKSGQYVASSSECSTKCKAPNKIPPTASKLPIKQSLASTSPYEDFKMRMGGICDTIRKIQDKGTISAVVSTHEKKKNISKEKITMLDKLCNPFKKMMDVKVKRLEPKTPSSSKDLTVSPFESKNPCVIVDDKIQRKIPNTEKELCIPQDSCKEITKSFKSLKTENISKPPISQAICKEDSSNKPCMPEKKSPCKVCGSKVVCEFEDKTCVCEIYNPCKQEHRDPPKQKTGDKVSICRIGSLHCECTERTNMFECIKETCKSTKDACKPPLPSNNVSCNGNNDQIQLKNCKIIEGKLVLELKNTCCVCEKFDPCNPEHVNIPKAKSTDKIASCVIENMYCNCVKRSDIQIPKVTRDVNADCSPKDDKKIFFQAIFDKIKLEREARACLTNRTKDAPTIQSLNCKDKTDTKVSIKLFAEICKKNKASSTKSKEPHPNPYCDMDKKDNRGKLNSKACGKVNWAIPVVKKTNPTCEQLSNAIIESMETASKPQSKSKDDCEILAQIPVDQIKSPKVKQSTAKPLNLCDNIAQSVESSVEADPCSEFKQASLRQNEPIKPKGLADSCISKVNSSLKEKNASGTSEKPASSINLHLKIKKSKTNQVSSGKDPKESIDIYVDVDFVNKTVKLTPSLKSCEVPSSNLKTSSKLSDPCISQEPCKPSFNCKEIKKEPKHNTCMTKDQMADLCKNAKPNLSHAKVNSCSPNMEPCVKLDPPKSKLDNPCIVFESKSSKNDPCKPKIDPCKPTVKCEDKSICKTKNEPRATKNDECCEKVDPCISFKNISSKIDLPTTNPCIVFETKSSKNDPCKPKIDPCKPTLKSEDKSARKTKNDQCATKNDESYEKVDPCISFKNISSNINLPTTNPCIVFETKSSKKDPCKPKIDPCKPTLKSEDKSARKTKKDPCATKNDESCEKVDPCISSKMEPPTSNPCIVAFDSKSTKSDPCNTKVDPCPKIDPCIPIFKCEDKSACKTQNDPCAIKNDESCEEVDPCISFKNVSSKMEPPTSNPCIVTLDSKSTKSDPCKSKMDPCPKIDPCKAILKSEHKSACKTKRDPCATKKDESCEKVDPCISFKNISSKMESPRVPIEDKIKPKVTSNNCKKADDPCESKIYKSIKDSCELSLTPNENKNDPCKKNAPKPDLSLTVELCKSMEDALIKSKRKATNKPCMSKPLSITSAKKDCTVPKTISSNITGPCKQEARVAIADLIKSKAASNKDKNSANLCVPAKTDLCKPKQEKSKQDPCKFSTFSGGNRSDPPGKKTPTKHPKDNPNNSISDPCATKADPYKPKSTSDSCDSKTDPCAIFADFCKPKTDISAPKENQCKAKLTSDPCAANADPCKAKTDFGAPKEDLCKSKITSNSCEANADRCKPKTDFGAPKEDLCKPKVTSDSCDSKTDPCAANADPCKGKTKFSAPKENPCKPRLTSDSCDSKIDPCAANADPCKAKTDFGTPKETQCKGKLTSDPCAANADPCKAKTDFRAPKEDPYKPKITSDSCDSKKDPCAVNADPCKAKTDFGARKEDLCKPKITSDSCDSKKDPCAANADPCKAKTDFGTPKETQCKGKLTSDPCAANADPCKAKTDFRAPKEDPYKPKITSDSCDSKKDPCAVNADPCKAKTDFGARKEDLCKPKITSDSCDSKKDPCAANADPCKAKTDFGTPKETQCKGKLTSDPCAANADPCKAKTDFRAPKEDPYKPKITSDSCDSKKDPCAVNADPCKAKTDFGARKEDLCKPKITSDSCDSKKDPCAANADPCKAKTDFGARKEDLCKSKITSDSCEANADPCKPRTDFRAPKEDLCKPKVTSDSCDSKTDPCAANADPCKPKTDFGAPKENPCKPKLTSDPCAANADPCKPKTDFGAPKEDLCKPKVTSDSCDSKIDPCAANADPCKPKTDFSAAKENPCKPKLTSDPCAANADPCKSKTDPCIDPGITSNVETNCSVMKEDPCKPKPEPCELNEGTPLTKQVTPDECTDQSRVVISDKGDPYKPQDDKSLCTPLPEAYKRIIEESEVYTPKTKTSTERKDEGINLECQQLDAKENMVSKFNSEVKPVKLRNTAEKSSNICEVEGGQLDGKENMISKFKSEVKPVKLHNTAEKSCNIGEVGCQQLDAKVNMISKFSAEVKPVKLHKTAEKSEEQYEEAKLATVPCEAKVDPCKDQSAITIKEIKQISENCKGGPEPDTCKYSSCIAKMPVTSICIIAANTLQYPYPPLTPPKAVPKSKGNIIKSKPQCLEIKDPKLHNEEMIDPKANICAPVMENNPNIKIEEPRGSQIAVEDPREQIAQIAISKADKLKNSLMSPEDKSCKKKDPCDVGKMEKIEMSEEMCRKLKGDADKKVCLFEEDDKGVGNFVQKSPTTDKGGNNGRGTCSEDSCKHIINVHNQPDCRPAPKHGQPPFKPDQCPPKHLTKEPQSASDIIVFPTIPPPIIAECIPHKDVYPPPNMRPPFMNPPRPKTNMTCKIDEDQGKSFDPCCDKPSTICCTEDSEPLQIKCHKPPHCSTIFDVTQHKQWCAVPVQGEPQVAGGKACAQYIERKRTTDETTTMVMPNLGTALSSPRFDVALPQPKEKEKDLVSGTRGLLQTICKVFCPKKKGDGKSEATGCTKQSALCAEVQPKAGCTLLPECGSEEDREALKAKTLKQWPFLEQRHDEGPNLLRGCQTMIDKQTCMANQRKCKPNPIDAPEDDPAQSRNSLANKNAKWRKC